MLFSAFTGSQPAVLLADDGSSLNDSQEGPAGDLSSINTLVDDSGGDTSVGGKSDSKAQSLEPKDYLQRRYWSLPFTKS